MTGEQLTVSVAMDDFREAFEAKAKLIEEQRNDFAFALGKQWEQKDIEDYKTRGVKAITDNRIRPNIFLLTGLERQSRSDFKAFPEGEEDSLKAIVLTYLFKNVIKRSEGQDKFSEMFSDGVTCGESGLELFLDSTFNLITPTPCWKKLMFDAVFPEPGWKEYDYSDAGYVYKYTQGMKKGDLIAMFPEMKDRIEKENKGLIDPVLGAKSVGTHIQGRDYPRKTRSGVIQREKKDNEFDLLERYYKKWVEKPFVYDTVSGDFLEADSGDDEDKDGDPIKAAKKFIRGTVKADPEQKGRFKIIKRTVPEIWYFALTGGIDKPLADERAWFYPNWRKYPFINYFAHWNTAPLEFDDAHLNIQGVTRGSKDSQIEHNKRKTQYLRHLDVSANSGWLAEENSWVDRAKVEKFGSVPGINLEYKRGMQKPERITPTPISQGHVFSAQESTDAIKQQTGINPDLLAQEKSGVTSGRAIALRLKQGIVIVQEMYDNLSRTKRLAGKFLLSQIGELFDLHTVKKVLGERFLMKNFGKDQKGPPDEQNPQGTIERVLDRDAMDSFIRDLLQNSNIAKYDVTVGEAVMSETARMAISDEIMAFVEKFPQLADPIIVIEESQLPANTKTQMINSIEQIRAQQAQDAQRKEQEKRESKKGANPNA